MKIYQTQVMFQDEPVNLSVGFGIHCADCPDTNDHQVGGGFFKFGGPTEPGWEIYIHAQRFISILLHEVVEGIILLQSHLYDQRWGENNTPMIVMNHDQFTVAIDRAAPAFINLLNLINDGFDSDMYSLIQPDDTPEGWVLIHDCDPQEEKPVAKKGKKKPCKG